MGYPDLILCFYNNNPFCLWIIVIMKKFFTTGLLYNIPRVLENYIFSFSRRISLQDIFWYIPRNTIFIHKHSVPKMVSIVHVLWYPLPVYIYIATRQTNRCHFKTPNICFWSCSRNYKNQIATLINTTNDMINVNYIKSKL